MFYLPREHYIKAFKFIGLAGLIACCVFLTRVVSEIYVNGFDRYEKLEIAAQAAAGPGFKKNTPLEQTYFGLRLKEKGLKFPELFSKWRWHESSFNSFAGLFGTMNKPASPRAYKVAKVFFSLFLFLVILGYARTRKAEFFVPFFNWCLFYLFSDIPVVVPLMDNRLSGARTLLVPNATNLRLSNWDKSPP